LKLLKCVFVFLLMITFAHVACAENYRVGATSTGIPFSFLDKKTGSIHGMMIDLIQVIAKDQGFTIEVQGLPFTTLIPSLQAGRIDIVSCALGITQQREKLVDFTIPVYTYSEGVVVSVKDAREYKSYDDFKGEVVGAQMGTVWVEPLKKTGIFKEVRLYNSMADVILDVGLGRIKAGFGDYPIIAYQTSQGVRIVRGIKPILTVDIGMAVKKGDKAKLEMLNKSLTKLKADGTLDKILVRWSLK